MFPIWLRWLIYYWYYSLSVTMYNYVIVSEMSILFYIIIFMLLIFFIKPIIKFLIKIFNYLIYIKKINYLMHFYIFLYNLSEVVINGKNSFFYKELNKYMHNIFKKLKFFKKRLTKRGNFLKNFYKKYISKRYENLKNKIKKLKKRIKKFLDDASK